MVGGATRDLVGRLTAIADELVGRGSGPTGAVLRVVTADTIVVDLTVGARQTHDGEQPLDEPLPVTRDTRFDVGSVTKVAVTTCLAMRLYDAGSLDLDVPVARWYPAFGNGAKREVTVRQLLTHRAGLWEWWPTYAFAREPADALAYAAGLPLRHPPATARHYSDLGFMLLGGIVERVAGRAIDDLAGSELFAPLGLDSSGFRAGAVSGAPVAATSHGDRYEHAMLATGDPYPVGVEPAAFAGWRAHTLVGEVNDGNAFHAFRGVAGHAGLFTTAGDLARLGLALLAALRGGGAWSAETVGLFTSPGEDPQQALGFRTARIGAQRVVGHSGFPVRSLRCYPTRALLPSCSPTGYTPGARSRRSRRGGSGYWRRSSRAQGSWHARDRLSVRNLL